jgi:phage/plasmid-like protein (TIGR03299 family)
MAHNLDRSTGTPAIAYVGETPWHNLGQRLVEGQPIEAWLNAAQLEWELEKLPVQYLVDGRLRTMADRYTLVRSDTGDALSVVSSGYNILQPKQVLEFYRNLMVDYGYELETAGALDGGRKVWALARTGTSDAVGLGGEDELAAYVLLATSCDKTLATTAAFTSVRVVCQNTLCFAAQDIKTWKRPQVKIPHNLLFEPESVKKELGLIDVAWYEFLRKARRMTHYLMKTGEASDFFEKLFLQKSNKELSAKAAREHQAIQALFNSAPGQELRTAKGTLWGAVNAVTYYVDHVRPGSSGQRLDSSWFGPGSLLKDRAWALANDLVSG